MEELPQATRRFLSRARAAGLDAVPRRFGRSTRTAQEAAEACGCELAQIVKSLVFVGRRTGEPYLLLVSGSNRVDASIAETTGEPLDRPDAGRVRALTGYAIGGIPPLGHDTPMRCLMDASLLALPLVWAAAGTPDTVFPVTPEALRRASGAESVRLAGERGEGR